MRGLGALAHELLLPGLEHYASDEDPLSAWPGAGGHGQEEAAGPIVTDPPCTTCARRPTWPTTACWAVFPPGSRSDHRPLDLGDDGDRLPCAG